MLKTEKNLSRFLPFPSDLIILNSELKFHVWMDYEIRVVAVDLPKFQFFLVDFSIGAHFNL